MNKKFYTAKYDRVFKTIFCSEDGQELFKEFLKRIFKKEIKELKLLRNEISITHVLDQVQTVDVFALVDGVYTHIELNTVSNAIIHIRNYNYFTSLYNRNVKRGENIQLEAEFVHIDFSYGLGKTKEVMTEYKVMDKRGKCYIENFKIMEYNMDRVKEFWYSKDREKIEEYKHLIMLDLEEEVLKELGKGDAFVSEFERRVVELNDEERFRSWMTKEEDMRVMANTERNLAYKEGEAKEKNAIARKMLKEKMEISTISRVTGLSEETIQQLK